MIQELVSKLFLVILLVLISVRQFSIALYDEKSNICHQSSCKPGSREMLSELCNNKGVYVEGRCCIHPESNNSGKHKFIIGVDLSDCELSSLLVFEIDNVIYNDTLYKKENISFIGAYNNPVKSCDVDFSGMTSLQTVWWPAGCVCPGGNASWEEVKQHYPDKQLNNTFCHEQVDLCNTTNIICPTHSKCVMSGPGNAECDCEHSWHGYKCLREGSFPMIVFIASILGGTLVISGLLWFLFRRKVHKID